MPVKDTYSGYTVEMTPEMKRRIKRVIATRDIFFKDFCLQAIERELAVAEAEDRRAEKAAADGT
jgi:hypothetical protein